MRSEVDVEAYFARIGYRGTRSVGLEALAGIHLLHPRAIPFENLNPFLRWPVHLDAASLQQKLVGDTRGGYCFEHNLLLSHALRHLGFQVKGLAARVLWNVAEGTMTPRSHMLLLIDLDDTRYLADVGFGGLTLTAPLRLQTDIEQSTPHEPFRLLTSGDGFLMQAKVAGTWRSLYTFDLQEQFLPDYEVTNWYLSNHPSSHFVTGLIAARADIDRRYTLRGNDVAVHHIDGRTERHLLTTVEELQAVLTDTFRVTVPDRPEVQQALQRVISRSVLALNPVVQMG